MTEEYFNELYKRIFKDVRNIASQWKSYLRSKNIYVYHEIDDIVQQMWLSIWQMADNLPDEIYIAMSLRDAVEVLSPDRIWVYNEFVKENKNVYVQELPKKFDYYDFLITKDGKRYDFIDNTFDKILFEELLSKRLTTRQWVIYNLIKDNRELTKREKLAHGKLGKINRGWSQAEIAEKLGITQQMVSVEIGKIKQVIKEVVDVKSQKN